MKYFRVAEIFGPTIQGEGRRIGTPCYFIRFGGCDYRCSWCDTPHAVLPDEVAKLRKLSADDIRVALGALPSRPAWVVLSGGNPLMLDLSEVMTMLMGTGYSTMVETQGTVSKPWINDVDDICVSPKPPSSGNETSPEVLQNFLGQLEAYTNPYLKVVVFDGTDYEYAVDIHQRFSEYPFYLSVGNEDPSLPTVGNPRPAWPGNTILTRETVLNKMAWLMGEVAHDKRLRNARVLPQMHTLAWGNARGR